MQLESTRSTSFRVISIHAATGIHHPVQRSGWACAHIRPWGVAARWLKAKGFHQVAAHLSDQACDFREVDYTRPTALLLGTELFGVSDLALDCVDQQISIPMHGMSESLNVSVAAAIVLYEAQRQRQAAGMYASSRMHIATRNQLRFEWLHPTVAEFCQKRNLDYPALDERGNLAEPFAVRS